MFCRNCGTSNSEGSKFCIGCGAKLEEATSPVEFENREETVAPVQPPKFNSAEQPMVTPSFYAEPAVVQPTEPQPPKKNNKTGLIVGIVAGVLVIIAAVFAILFATGVFEGDSKKSEETEESATKKKTETTTEESQEENQEETDDKQKNESYTVEVDIIDENGVVVEEDKEVTFEIPYDYVEEYAEMFESFELQLGNLTFDVSPIYRVVDGNHVIEVRLEGNVNVSIGSCFSYSSEELTAENCNGMFIQAYIPNFKGSQIVVEYAKDKEENGYANIYIDGALYAGVTSSGYTVEDGKFYDPQGNEITESEYFIKQSDIEDKIFRNIGI